MGWFTIFADPDGNTVALWQSDFLAGVRRDHYSRSIQRHQRDLRRIGAGPRRRTELRKEAVTMEASRRTAGRRAGHDPTKLPLAINSHGYVAENSRRATDEYYRPYLGMMNKVGRERGWRGMDRAQYDGLRAPGGALHVGSPQEVIDKILVEHEIFANDRFLLHLSVGTLPHDKVLRAIEMFGTKVAPVVRRATKAASHLTHAERI